MLILTETSGRVTDSGSLTWENLTVYFTCRGVAAGVAVDTLAASLLLLTLSVHVAGTDSSHSKLSLSVRLQTFPGLHRRLPHSVSLLPLSAQLPATVCWVLVSSPPAAAHNRRGRGINPWSFNNTGSTMSPFANRIPPKAHLEGALVGYHTLPC